MIESNEIRRTGGNVITVVGVDGASISGNRFKIGQNKNDVAVRIVNCTDVIEGNANL